MSLQDKIFPINSKPFGIGYSEWCIRWWQWIASIPLNQNPTSDWNGEKVHTSQNDENILFLCQTYDYKKVKHIPFRKNQIEKGKSIFMPIINWISIGGIDGNTDEELSEIAKLKMNVIGKLTLTINGVSIQNGLERNRILTPFFEVYLPNNNIFRTSPGTKRCISDGYWVFLKPVFEDITLSSFSSCSSGETIISVKYDLTSKELN